MEQRKQRQPNGKLQLRVEQYLKKKEQQNESTNNQRRNERK